MGKAVVRYGGRLISIGRDVEISIHRAREFQICFYKALESGGLLSEKFMLTLINVFYVMKICIYSVFQ